MLRALRACARPGCPNFMPCPVHRQDGRAGAYGADWAAFSAAWLKSNPWCVRCATRRLRRRARLVDHITPVRVGGGRLDPTNVRALCWPCHNQITRREPPTSTRRLR